MITAKEIVEIIREKHNIKKTFDLGFIVGSGLSDSVPEMKEKIVISYNEVGMPTSKIPGYHGEFVFGKLNGKDVVKLTRYYYYETGEIERVRLPLEILSLLGVKTLIMASSCDAVSDHLEIGDLMVIKDHINFAGTNPLIGMENIQFVDMTNAYDSYLRRLAIEAGKMANFRLKEGVAMQFCGPTYETAAETSFAKFIGVSIGSMSVAFDTICARYYGIKVLAFASIINKASNLDGKEMISKEEAKKYTAENAKKLKLILDYVLAMI